MKYNDDFFGCVMIRRVSCIKNKFSSCSNATKRIVNRSNWVSKYSPIIYNHNHVNLCYSSSINDDEIANRVIKLIEEKKKKEIEDKIRIEKAIQEKEKSLHFANV